MKKTLLLTLALLLSVTISAQSRISYINEYFNSEDFPTGWSFEGYGLDNWIISNTSNAGGNSNEMMLYWKPTFEGVSRLVSPAMDLTDITDVVVSFKAFFDNYHEESNVNVGVATTSDNGVTWNLAWKESGGISGQYSFTKAITTPDMGKENVKFCIFFEGNSGNINGWYFDDINIYALDDLNLGIMSVDMPEIIGAKDNEVSFSVRNTGKETITSLRASCQVDDNEVVTQDFEVNLSSLQTERLSFQDKLILSPGLHNITISIMDVNGKEDILTDNVLSTTINVAFGFTQRIPMIEHFSSSTCFPCVLINSLMHKLTEENPGKYTYTKYVVDWPVSGDPYYTIESGIRKDYYQVGAVPYCLLDSELQLSSNATNPVTKTALLNRYEVPAIANVRGSFTVDGNTINVIADFMTYFDAENIKAYISVNEKTTTENASANGETEFHHVMMKMLGDVDGNDISINAGEYKRLEFSYDMSQTFMEDINDLEVALWLQDYESKEIYNSHYAYEYTEHPYPVQNLQLADNDTSLLITWEAPEKGNPVGYNIYINDSLIAENHNDLSYSTKEAKDLAVVKVVAVYENDKTSVEVAKYIEINTSTPMLIPTYFVAEPVSDTSIMLIWNSVENALSYNIYRNDEFLENVMDTSYVDEGLISGTEYCYTVAAVGKDAESDKSAESCAIPLGDDPEEPGDNPEQPGDNPEQPGDNPEQPGDDPDEPGDNPENPGDNPEQPGDNPEEPGDDPEEPIELDIPANVKANAISVSSIVVTWDFVVNATSYNLYRDDELIKNVTATNYIDEDLKYNTEYCYSVIAIYDEIKSDKSENVCVKTLGESVEEMLSAFRIYPNPADDKLYIETLTQTVEIFDVYGRRHVSEVPSRQGDLTIDVTSLNSGIYFVKVVTSEGEVLKRFVKK